MGRVIGVGQAIQIVVSINDGSGQHRGRRRVACAKAFAFGRAEGCGHKVGVRCQQQAVYSQAILTQPQIGREQAGLGNDQPGWLTGPGPGEGGKAGHGHNLLVDPNIGRVSGSVGRIAAQPNSIRAGVGDADQIIGARAGGDGCGGEQGIVV